MTLLTMKTLTVIGAFTWIKQKLKPRPHTNPGIFETAYFFTRIRVDLHGSQRYFLKFFVAKERASREADSEKRACNHPGERFYKRCVFGELIHWVRVDGGLIRVKKICGLKKYADSCERGLSGRFFARCYVQRRRERNLVNIATSSSL